MHQITSWFKWIGQHQTRAWQTIKRCWHTAAQIVLDMLVTQTSILALAVASKHTFRCKLIGQTTPNCVFTKGQNSHKGLREYIANVFLSALTSSHEQQTCRDVCLQLLTKFKTIITTALCHPHCHFALMSRPHCDIYVGWEDSTGALHQKTTGIIKPHCLQVVNTFALLSCAQLGLRLRPLLTASGTDAATPWKAHYGTACSVWWRCTHVNLKTIHSR